jgi:hypothetical protein
MILMIDITSKKVAEIAVPTVPPISPASISSVKPDRITASTAGLPTVEFIVDIDADCYCDIHENNNSRVTQGEPETYMK